MSCIFYLFLTKMHPISSWFFPCPCIGYLPARLVPRDEVAPRPRRIGQELWQAPLQDMGGSNAKKPRKTDNSWVIESRPKGFVEFLDDFVWSLVLFFCKFRYPRHFRTFWGTLCVRPFFFDVSRYQQTKLKFESGRCNSDCIV